MNKSDIFKLTEIKKRGYFSYPAFFCIAFLSGIFLILQAQSAYAAQCGYANGSSYSSAPQSVGSLCVAGTPGAVSGSGPWNWTCSDGGGTANCSSGICGVTFEWREGTFGACDCGTRLQSRGVWCYRNGTMTDPDQSGCYANAGPKPAWQQSCTPSGCAPAYTYSWIQGGFGACSASCGGGTQTQTVTCQRNDGVSVADSNCSGAKPATSQSCNPQACAVACSGNITYSNQSLCADGRCYGYGYDPYSLNYPSFWTVNGSAVLSGNINPDSVNNNPSNSGFTWRASTYNSTGQPNPPPFPQTSDLVYKVSAAIGGATHNLNFTIPLGSRRAPAWAPQSGAWYEGIYETTQSVSGASCKLRVNTGWWATIGGVGARDIYGDISCTCEGRPMTPSPTCGAANDPNGHRSAGEVNNAGLCTNGMSADVGGSGPWNWTCSTPNNGASVNCSAPVCVPSSENISPCEGNGYDAVYDNCGNFKRIIANPACDFGGWEF